MLNIMGNSDIPDDLKNRSQKLMSMFDDEVENLLEWIQQPIYSPDFIKNESTIGS
jgi:hypothetical protein